MSADFEHRGLLSNLTSLLHHIIIFFFAHASLPQKTPSGIFITIEPLRKTPCENEVRMIIDKSKVCISKKPIIAIKDLKNISDIQYDPINKMHYIDVGFSPAGIYTLNNIVRSLPDTKFALVVDNHVICIFQVDAEISIHSIRIGQDVALKDLITIHNALKKVNL
jgi:hypothetical protein